MNPELDMVTAWKTAAVELDLHVIAPFEVNGVSFPLFLADFGSSDGALLLLIGDETRRKVAKNSPYFYSMLNPKSYGRFDRKHFEDTLNDWQWCGKTAPPAWYTGKTWT